MRNSVRNTVRAPIGVAFAATAGAALILELTRRVAGIALVIITAVFLVYTFTAHLLPGILEFTANPYTWQRFFGHVYSDAGILGPTTAVVDLHHPLHHLRGLPAGLQSGRLLRQLRLRRRRPRARWPGQGGDLRLRPDGHDQRHFCGQRGGHRFADHPADEEGGLPQARQLARSRPRPRPAGRSCRRSWARVPSSWPRSPASPIQEIAIAAIIPAVLYFVSIYFMVDFEAAKLGMRGMREDELPKFAQMIRQVYPVHPDHHPDRGAVPGLLGDPGGHAGHGGRGCRGQLAHPQPDGACGRSCMAFELAGINVGPDHRGVCLCGHYRRV
jgi:hypothetical protein